MTKEWTWPSCPSASQDHDIALIKAPEGVDTGSPGLSHTALKLEGGDEGVAGDLRAGEGRRLSLLTSPPTTG